MKALRLAVGFALLLGLAGCGGSDQDTATKTVMPDVKGRQLDVALSDIKRAGFEDEVEVIGGGTFGIVVKSNWKVCDQSPAAGQALKGAPRLTVDRSCGDGATESTTTTTTSPPTTTTTTTTTTTAPPTTTTEPPPPQTEPPTTTSPPSADVYYANCTEARAAGAAPLHRGEPGYRAGLDRDGDGVACE